MREHIYKKISEKIGGKTFYAFFWSFISSFSAKLISFLISIFLARLLTPDDFGIIALTMAVVYIGSTFVGFGFQSALIQRKDIEDGLYSSVFWICSFIGFLLFCFIYIFSDIISAQIGGNELNAVLKFVSLIIFIESLTIIHKTILRRDLDFKSLTTRSIYSDSIGGIAAIFAAFYGYGVYSLVILHLVKSFIGLILYWRLVKWRPKFIIKYKPLRSIFGFSFFKFIDSILQSFFERISTFFIGLNFGSSNLGYYNRANSINSYLFQLISLPVTNVIYPKLSSNQNDLNKATKTIVISNNAVSYVICLCAGILFIWADDIIVLLYGDQWISSIEIFKILILGSIVIPLKNIQIAVILSKGKSKNNFYLNFIDRFLVVISLVIGYYYGLFPFLWSNLFSSLIFLIVQFYYTSNIFNLSFVKLFSMPFLYFIIMIFSSTIYSEISNPDSYGNRLILSSSLLFILTISFFIDIKKYFKN